MTLRIHINAALSIVGAMKRNLAEGRQGVYMVASLNALINAINSAKELDTNQDNAAVYAKLIDTAQNAREDAEVRNTDVANMTENINKIDEYVTEIARRANVGGRRRKTRKGRKGKKRATRASRRR